MQSLLKAPSRRRGTSLLDISTRGQIIKHNTIQNGRANFLLLVG